MSDEDFEFDKPEYGSRDLTVALREADFDLARKILETCPEILQNEKNGGRGYWVVSQVKVSGVKGIKLLVEFGASVNDKWSDIKAIDSASSRGNFELVEWLIEQGATIQEEMPDGRLNCAALRSAVQHGHFAIVKRLVELGANVNSGAGIANALMDASAYGQTEIADYLRSHGAVDWRDTTPPDFKAGEGTAGVGAHIEMKDLFCAFELDGSRLSPRVSWKDSTKLFPSRQPDIWKKRVWML